MKMFYYLLVLVPIFLVSCTDCTWVQTDYYYDDDGEAVEEGYYDCPEENPVSYDFLRTPEIDIDYTNTKRNYFNECTYTSNFKIRNWGSGNAFNVLLKIIIRRHDVMNLGEMKIEIIKEYDLIESFSNEIINNSFKDISYNGHSLYSVSVKVDFADKNGKLRNFKKYYEF